MTEEVRALGNIFFIPARFLVALFGAIGMAILYGLRVNLSVTMVAMLNHTAIAAISHKENGTSSSEDGPFIWSEPLQGTLLSCYFWGYMVSMYPGGYLAENKSAKWVFFAGVALNVIATLLSPILTEIHYLGLLSMRVLQGIGSGPCFPCMHCMVSSWAPPLERSIMSTLVYAGTSFGTFVSILMAGWLSANWGWKAVFYVMGGLSLIWMLLWAVLITDSPRHQRFITEEERQMIIAAQGAEKGKGGSETPPLPWRYVLTSLPFWAIFIANCTSNWGWFMLLLEIPFYMKQILKFHISSNATLSALPYLPMIAFTLILGKILDDLRESKTISTTTARKIATFFCTIPPSICLHIMSRLGSSNVNASVVTMCVAIVCMGGMFSGFLINHIDIAPNFAGTLVALTNTIATISGIAVPIFVGYVTKGNHTIEAWTFIFNVTICSFVTEFTIFTIFGSGEEQFWNRPENINNR